MSVPANGVGRDLMGSSLFNFQWKTCFSSRHASPVHKIIANNIPVQAQDNQVAATAILKSHPQDLSELWTWYTTEFDGNSLSVPEKEAMWSGTTCKGRFLGILSDKLYWPVCTVHGHSTSVTSIINRPHGDKNTNRLHISLCNRCINLFFCCQLPCFPTCDFLEESCRSVPYGVPYQVRLRISVRAYR